MQYYVAELFTGDLNVRFTAGAYLRKQYRLLRNEQQKH
jgi:hypothetical protein